MRPTEVIQLVRDRCVEELRLFVTQMRAELKSGGVEVQMQIPGDEVLFRQLVRIDFVAKVEGMLHVRYFMSDRPIEFTPFKLIIHGVAVQFSGLKWDQAEIVYEGPPLAHEVFGAWHDTHFDKDDLHRDPKTGLGRCIHALWIKPGLLEVNFGSANVEALHEFLAVLVNAGASNIEVRIPVE